MQIEPLQLRHAVEAFECGEDASTASWFALPWQTNDQRDPGFDEHFGFRPSPTDPLHLFVLLKDLSRAGDTPRQ